MLLNLFVFIALFLLFIPNWIIFQFGEIELSAIIFHIFVPLKDIPSDWAKNIYWPIILIIISFSLSVFIKNKIVEKQKYFDVFFAFFVGLFIFDLLYINKTFLLADYIKNQIQSSDFIEKNYVDPNSVKITFPNKKQNLIFISVESLESSIQNKQSGGLFDENYIKEMTEIAQKNISFSYSDKIEGAVVLPETGWTMGGIVAETAGLPLKSYTLHKSHDQVGNNFGRYKKFLDGVVALGDLLEEEGYSNYFILGSNKDFAGKDMFFTSHGHYKICDRDCILAKHPEIDYKKGWWGLSDRDTFEFAKKRLPIIAQNKVPFHLFIQTVDSHREGMLSPACEKKYDEQIKNVYTCVSSLVNDFILWLQKQDFYSDTTIVILGDHNNMSNSIFLKDIDKETGLYEGIERRVFNAFINTKKMPLKEKNRFFSTMDMYPTILSAIGAEIDGHRLGLGTDLFSTEKTLLEKFGYNYLFQELRKQSMFYNKKFLYAQ